MSAFSDLEDLMIGTYGMPEEKVYRMLDVFEDEVMGRAAQQQRDYLKNPYNFSGEKNYWWFEDSAEELIDLIDPRMN